MFKDIYWMSSLTMEEVFIVTGLALVIVGVIGGLLMWKFTKAPTENEEENE
jgi:hypothetical protein